MMKKIFVLTVILIMCMTDSLSARSEESLRQDEQPFYAELEVIDKTGSPVPDVWIWLVSDSEKIFQGWTNNEGFATCKPEKEKLFEVYFAGKKASLVIDEIKDNYSLTLPVDLTDLPDDLPRIIVSLRPDDSDPGRFTVTISGDSLTSEPEVTIHGLTRPASPEPCSADIPMESSDGGRLWTGTGEYECEYDWLFIEVIAVSESGLSHSMNLSGIYEADQAVYPLYSGAGGEMLCDSDSFGGSGKIGITENRVPVPENGELVQLEKAWGLEFSDGVGQTHNTEFSFDLPLETLRGLDAAGVTLYGWNRADHSWDPVSVGNCSCSAYHDECHVGISPESVSYKTYALFAPPSDDTVPPGAVTDLHAYPGDSEWHVTLEWTAPADDRSVFAYDIRRNTVPVTESEWDGSSSVYPVPPPAEPGSPQSTEIPTGRHDPDTEYYFGIRSMDAAGNWSPVTSTESPVKTRVIDDDGDGMRDSWEDDNGLDPAVDDSQGDRDRDGLTNLQEYEHGTYPRKPDSDGDSFSDSDEVYLGSDPRDDESHPDSATVRIAYETGEPVRGAEIWLASGTRKSLQGKSDGDGLVISTIGTGTRLEAYSAGRKASLEIDEIKDEYQIVMPPAQENIPGTVASVTTDDSAPGRVTLTIFADSPLSEPEVSLYQPPGYSADLPMTSPDSLVWSGTADISSDWGVFEITAVSGSAQSISAACFEIRDIEPGDWTGHEFRETELMIRDDFPGSGKLVFTESPAPSPPNGDLVRVGNVRNLFFSENVGTVTRVRLEAHLSADQLEGADFTQLNFFGWDTENRTWNLIPEDGNLSSDLTGFRISADSLDYTSYALFAPRLDDTTPPGPVTDFQARTDSLEYCDYFEEEGCVYITWVSPADDQVIHTYDIRYNTVPVTESNWDDCTQLSSSDYSDDEPGIVHRRRIGTSEPGTAFYFGIQAVDVAGNRSPVAFFNTPVISSADRDGDSMEDSWETANGLDPVTDDAQSDKDGDGLTNLREYEYSLDPDDPDMDDDGYSDGDEMRFGGHPRDEAVRPSGDLDCDSDIGLGDAVLALRLLIADTVPGKLCLSDIDWDDRIGLAETIFILRGLAEEE